MIVIIVTPGIAQRWYESILNTRSTCKLCVISAVAPHASLAHTTSPVNEGRNLDNDIKAQAAVILVCMTIPPPPPTTTDLCAL